MGIRVWRFPKLCRAVCFKEQMIQTERAVHTFLFGSFAQTRINCFHRQNYVQKIFLFVWTWTMVCLSLLYGLCRLNSLLFETIGTSEFRNTSDSDRNLKLTFGLPLTRSTISSSLIVSSWWRCTCAVTNNLCYN